MNIKKIILVLFVNLLVVGLLHSQDTVKTDLGNAASQNNNRENSSAGLSLGMAIAIDNTAEGYQRISFAPEFVIGKLGIALDIELFIDLQKGELIDRGWVFNEATAVDDFLRKIKYLRWSTREEVLFGKDHIYFKLGILDNITLGTGLIFNTFNNSFYYPDRKPLGLNLVLNGHKLFPLGLEFVVHSFNELSTGGPIMGSRYLFLPKMPN